MNYTLHQLQIFVKVAEKQSITKAAEELHLTQPAVSIQLKNFQDQFDIPLIDSIGRNIFVTDFGKEIESVSRRILSEMEQIRNTTLAYQGHLAGKLSVSVVSTGKYVIPYFLSDFLRKYPKIQLTMDVTNRGKVLESMAGNEVDFALVSLLPTKLSVERVELMRNELYLVGSPKVELASDKINIQTLKKMPLIFREKGSATRQAMENFIKENEVYTDKIIELTSNEAVKQALLAGLGFSIMPKIGLRNELQNGELKVIQLKGLPIVTNWNLIYRSDKVLSPIAQKYLEYINEHKERIIHDKFGWYEKED